MFLLKKEKGRKQSWDEFVKKLVYSQIDKEDLTVQNNRCKRTLINYTVLTWRDIPGGFLNFEYFKETSSLTNVLLFSPLVVSRASVTSHKTIGCRHKLTRVVFVYFGCAQEAPLKRDDDHGNPTNSHTHTVFRCACTTRTREMSFMFKFSVWFLAITIFLTQSGDLLQPLLIRTGVLKRPFTIQDLWWDWVWL